MATASRVLAAAGPGELLTKARAFSALGRAKCWKLDPGGRRDLAALHDAERYLDRAARLYDQLGMRIARAGLIPYLAMWIKYQPGRGRRRRGAYGNRASAWSPTSPANGPTC